MSYEVLRTEALSKRYRLGISSSGVPYQTVREALVEAFRRRRATNDPRQRVPTNDDVDIVWALRDVCFSVTAGETIGVIGRNGAGKSTLLKILSGITQPTSGRALVRGRVASLLEVGTGFHPELTGRENLFLNGAILGMSRGEIRRKFDEIVAFAEVERFIDTPVKRYSSGMYTRLAFSVAAHLEPEILLVDEVLAVGDSDFQRKCLGKMESVATNEGRTVLFVSHNLHAVASLCRSVLLMHRGQVAEHGPTRAVIERYLASDSREGAEKLWSNEAAPGNDEFRIQAVRIRRGDGEVSYDIGTSEAFAIEMEFACLRSARVTPSFHVYNSHGLILFSTANLHDARWRDTVYEPGAYRCACTVPANLLNEGQYHVSAYLSRESDGLAHAQAPMAVSFRVIDDGGGRGGYVGEWPGLIRPLLPWEMGRAGDE